MNFNFTAQNGGINMGSDYNRSRFVEYLKKHEGRKFQIKPIAGGVSDNRRGWYRAGVIPFLQELVPSWANLSEDQVHEVLKTEFNGFTVIDKKGNTRKYGQSVSSRDVSSDKFDDYILRISEWVRNNYGQELPDPENYKYMRDTHQI